jgi:hypothetical protein
VVGSRKKNDWVVQVIPQHAEKAILVLSTRKMAMSIGWQKAKAGIASRDLGRWTREARKVAWFYSLRLGARQLPHQGSQGLAAKAKAKAKGL